MQRYLSSRTCILCSRALRVPEKRYHGRSTFNVDVSSRNPIKIRPSNSVNKLLPTYAVKRNLRTSSKWDSDSKDDKIDYASDPEVKRLLSELRSDFAKESENSEKDLSNDDEAGKEESNKAENHPKSTAKQGADTRIEAKSDISKVQYSSLKYEKFSTSKSQIIYDYDEEQRRLEEGIVEEEGEGEEILLERGKTGVFDIEELVDFLREENARDIVVIEIPPEIKYVSYMVVVSSLSQRHINALAETIRLIYKKKKNKGDPFIICEGKSTNWVAIDMGNIALHIMKPDVREQYDLETLWTVGSQFDDKCQGIGKDPSDILSALEQLTGIKDTPPVLRP